MDRRNAIVLLSGGLDSATTLAIANEAGYRCFALSFRYGQKHAVELQAARAVAEAIGVIEHREVQIDLRAFGGSALTSEVNVPKNRSSDDIGHGIPVTYVPARNIIFLSFAVGWAEVLGARHIFIGVNSVDFSGYPDCRRDFIDAFERAVNLGTKSGTENDHWFRIETPLVTLSKADIIRRGIKLGVEYEITSSCYDPPRFGIACGCCDSCIIRRRGFSTAGVPDPTRYSAGAIV